MKSVISALEMFQGHYEVDLASIEFFSRFLKFYINHNWNPHESKDTVRQIAGIDL
jgi:hypothetical protein